VLSPNDVRAEEGWPASTDETADSIAPPVTGGKPAAATDDEPKPTPPPVSDDAGSKIIDIGRCHAGD
jgi:hypothetical protein